MSGRRKDSHNPLDVQLVAPGEPQPRSVEIPGSSQPGIAGLQVLVLPHFKAAGASLQQQYKDAEQVLLDSKHGAKGSKQAVKAAVRSTHTSDGIVKPGQYEAARTALLVLNGKALAATAFVSLGADARGVLVRGVLCVCLACRHAIEPSHCSAWPVPVASTTFLKISSVPRVLCP